MKPTFATLEFGYKNLLKIERPTSESFISEISKRMSQPRKGGNMIYL
jgi:hypothetical protein